MERVCVFIDGNNFYFALKRNNRSTRVDYHQFSLALAGPDRELLRTYYYNAAYDKNTFPDKAKSQSAFFDSLDRTPRLELRLGKLAPTKDGDFQEKGVDILMASDMVYYTATKTFNTAIVVTEDGSYAPALLKLKELGAHVEIAGFPDAQNRDLAHAADIRLPLDQVLEKYAAKIFPGDPDDGRADLVGRMGRVQKSFSK